MRSPIVRQCCDDDWHKFIENVIDLGNPFFSTMVERMTTGVTFIGRQESLKRDLISFLEIARIPYCRETLLRTPRKNAARQPHDCYPYKAVAYSAIRRMEGEVYERFYADE